MTTNILTQQAGTNLGDGFVLVGEIKPALTTATADAQGNVTLTVSAQGTWTYRFTDAQKLNLARLIAGKRVQETQQLLASQAGVAHVSIKPSGGSGQTLPSDPAKITITTVPE